MTRRQFMAMLGACALVPAATSQGTRIKTGLIPWLKGQKFQAEPASMVMWDEQDWSKVNDYFEPLFREQGRPRCKSR